MFALRFILAALYFVGPRISDTATVNALASDVSTAVIDPGLIEG